MRRSFRWMLLVGLGLAWTAPAARAQERHVPVVAVFLMESKSSPLKADETAGLTDYMSARLGESGHFQIIPRDEIKKRLTASKQESFKDCYDSSCQIEIGKELAAEFSISSSIGRVGSQCLISASVWDLGRSTQIRSATARQACDVDRLVEAVEKVTDQLAAAMRESLGLKGSTRTPPPQTVEAGQPEPVEVKPAPARTETEAPGAVGEEEFVPPRFYISFSMLGMESIYLGSHDSFINDFAMGFTLDLDFRLGQSFMLGLYLDYQEYLGDMTGIAGVGAGLRLGGLVWLNDRVALVPFARLGLVSALWSEGCLDCEDNIGFYVGAGFGAKFMLLSWLGLGADLRVGYFNFPEYEDFHCVDVGFDLGAVVAF